ncbi:S46 family peptidase [Cellvibrio sp. UBA7661]|uniref:S46 family peptidase n=1 Tax=Cellvibrio sp. UBA7661 TaxID=1946311 RepID=UPI002F3548FA
MYSAIKRAKRMTTTVSTKAFLLASSLCVSLPGIAAEGMWTLDNLPHADLEQRYGFKPSAAWIDKSMRSAVRLAGGCSGSFVSANGLVLTNHHCVINCVEDLSSPTQDFMKNGFLARNNPEEKQCPGVEVNRLEHTKDVTERMQKALVGLSGKAFSDAKKAEQSSIEKECMADTGNKRRCDIVELYGGGQYYVYQYSRYQDVRLVFTPEYASGFFGGDPDNFNFPRYNLDMALLRVYEDGKPIANRDWFPINTKGAKENELVMTLGHPGTTQRLLTMAELETQRDLVLPFRLLFAAEYRGLLLQYSNQGDEQARIAQTELTLVENGLKARTGMFQALLSRDVMEQKREQENTFRNWVESDATRAKTYGNPWQTLTQTQTTFRNMYVDYVMLELGMGIMSQQITWARTLVRGAEERNKPDHERLREFSNASLPAVQAGLLAESPLYSDFETMKLAWSLSKLREKLGVDNPVVKHILGKESPEALAKRIVSHSKLSDAALRKQLWEGGADAIAKSDDPAIALAKIIDTYARKVRMDYDQNIEPVQKAAASQLAQARFAYKGTQVYPDATFSLRLSHGVIRGWEEKGEMVTPFTTLAGLFDRATGYDPFKLADSWSAAQKKVDKKARFNQVSTNDIIGGNSGSPLINAKGELVGLIFDGNINSLGGAYFFDESVNRSVSVHPAAMAEALKKVYRADHLVKELKLK